MEQNVAKHGGEVIQFLGDGALAAFPSAVQAVHAAVAIQKEARTDDELPLRVGIDEGEITFDAQGPYGDSLNIAARIQALAIPGSVLISGKVHDDIKNRPSIRTVRLGMFAMKNVAEPMEVYAVAVEGVVTNVRWANPHVYLGVEQTTDAGETIEWEVETVGPSALDPTVFTSRFISWSRKSSFRPQGSAASVSDFQCSRWPRKRTTSSVMSDRATNLAISCAIAVSSARASARNVLTRSSSRARNASMPLSEA